MSSESEECEDGSPRRKRQKTSSQSAPQEANSQIQSLEDLRRLLVFEQDASPHTEQSKIFEPSLYVAQRAYRNSNIQKLPEGH